MCDSKMCVCVRECLYVSACTVTEHIPSQERYRLKEDLVNYKDAASALSSED